MKGWRPTALLGCLAISASLEAQVSPQPGSGDPRFQTVAYAPQQVVLIEAAPGYQVTVELAPDEQVQTIAVGDTAAWSVAASRAGNELVIKPLGTQNTNVTVVTSVRRYAFELDAVALPSPTTPYSIRFVYPANSALAALQARAGEAVPGAEVKAGINEGLYKISGDKALRPSTVGDDGLRTYIDWPTDVALPAVYLLDRGRETLANGNMRGDVYVIDSVNDHLVFRIDNHVARADRQRVRTPR